MSEVLAQFVRIMWWKEIVGDTAPFHHIMAASGLYIDYRCAIVGELTQRSSCDDTYDMTL